MNKNKISFIIRFILIPTLLIGIYSITPALAGTDPSMPISEDNGSSSMIQGAENFPTIVTTSPLPGEVLRNNPPFITVQFSVNMLADGTAFAVNKAANYLLVESGTDGKFQTASCAAKLAGDDTQVAITNATYNATNFTSTLSISDWPMLNQASYQLLVCASTGINDLNGNRLNNGSDFIIRFLQIKDVDLYPYINYGGAGKAVGIGDFNHDNFTDVAMSTVSQLLVYLNNGSGSLAAPVAYPAGSRSDALAVGDLNHDGWMDVVTADFSSNTISVFLQQSDGALASRITYATSTGPDAIAVGDVTGDGLADIVISHWNAPSIGVFAQNANGNLNTMSTYPVPLAGGDDLAIGDVNNDGLNDVISLNGDVLSPKLSIFLQTTTGTLATAIPYEYSCSVCGAGGVGVGDVTGDGRSDVIVSFGGNRPSSKIAVFSQGQDGGLQNPVYYDSYDIPESIELADINLDGTQDILLLHGGWKTLGVFLQIGEILQPESLYTIPNVNNWGPQALSIGDINQDGALDVAISDGNYGLTVLYYHEQPAPRVIMGGNALPVDGEIFRAGPSHLNVQFDRKMKSDGGISAANNSTNYLLIDDGADNNFQTNSCASGVMGDDSPVSVDSVTYNNEKYFSTLSINGGIPLGVGNYRLFVCGTTSIEDTMGNKLNGGLSDGVINFMVWTATLKFVKADATGASNGTTWADAYTDLQSAISAASSGDEIWVAAGTYKPTAGTDRSISFTLKSGVAVYGGFNGTETALAQRNVTANVTILSGDIGSVGVNTDNSYHVVVSSNTNSATILDGFTILGGYTADSGVSSYGGGLYNYHGSPTLSNLIFKDNSAYLGGGMFSEGDYSGYIVARPTLTNVTFLNNTGRGEGGGMENRSYSQPTLTNVSFIGNVSNRSGGGMINLGNCDSILTNVTFTNNTAFAGGGLSNLDSSSILTNVTFENNTSSDWAGGMDNAGNGATILTNVTFRGNSAISHGGAISNHVDNVELTLINVTINGNSAGTNGDGIYNDEAILTIRNSILYGNGEEIYGPATVTNSIVQGGYAGTGNLDADPLLDPLQDNGGFTKTMALLPGSPAIDAGDDANCPATDQRGVARPQGAHCDIGAYEYNTIIPTVTLTPSITPSPTFTRTPTAINRPDLMIVDMKIEMQNTGCRQSGDSLGVRVWVTNDGQTAASAFVIQVNGVTQNISGLGAGEMKNVFFFGYSNPITAIVDSTNLVQESDENNNSVTQNVPVPTPPLPCTPTFTPSRGPTASRTLSITPTQGFTPTKSRTPSPTPTRPRPFMRSQILTPASLTSDFGTTSGSLPSLGLLEQTGAEDDPAAYVSFQTPNTVYMGYQSFSLPTDARADLIASMLLQVNFKGDTSTTWTWSAYDWKSAQWIPLGNSIGAKAGVWKTFLFPIRTPWRFMSSRGEIRIQLKSNNASSDAKMDYEALHLTYLSIPATVTPLPTSSYKKGAPFVPTSTP